MVRLSRLVIEANQNRISLALHPRLTVVAGVPAPVRAHLVSEILGGFTGRPGVHLEMVNEAGRRITVVRPLDGPHRVSAADEGLDLTEDFRSPTGGIDVLERYGIDTATADEVLHLNGETAGDVGPDDARIAHLSGLNQPQLWSQASRVQVTSAELQTLNDAIHSNAMAAEANVATIEKRHQSLESAIGSQQLTERSLLRIAGVALLIAVVAGAVLETTYLPFALIAVVAIAAAVVFRGKVRAAAHMEESALASVGSNSYLGYMVNQVNGMMSDTEQRRRLTGVAADHREAAIAWNNFVGDIAVDWAMAHREEIDAAARLRHQLASMNTLTAAAPDLDERATAIASSVLGRISSLRRIGYGAESFPLLLDDPFVDLDSATRIALLELISSSAGSPQIILLTGAADVANWARRAAGTGEVALIEPGGPGAKAPVQAQAQGSTSAAPERRNDQAVARTANEVGANGTYGAMAHNLAV